MQKRLACFFALSVSPLIAAHSKLPLYFEPIPGPVAGDLQYLSRGPQHELVLSSSKIDLSVRSVGQTSRRMTMGWVGGNSHPSVEALQPIEGVSNYLLGDDPGRWRTNVPHFGEVRYRQIYPGVDL